MNAPAQPFAELPLLAAGPWQMSYGERAALEGVLAQLQPQLAVEIGTAEGGSLSRIAAWSGEVHSFDLVEPAAEVAALPNVVRHTGDSHALLPQVLAELAAADRNVEFMLIDGDHSAEGVRQDVEDVLGSDAVQRTVIMLHDTMNDVVRAGLEAVDYSSFGKATLVELDMVPGYLARREPYRLDLWGGLGMIIVDGSAPGTAAQRDDRFHELVSLVRPARDALRQIEAAGRPLDAEPPATVESALREHLSRSEAVEAAAAAAEVARAADEAELRAALAVARQRIAGIESSLSWRATGPMRRLRHGRSSRR